MTLRGKLLAFFLAIAAIGFNSSYFRPTSAEASEGPLKVIGFLNSGSSSELLRMIVDPELNIGATIGNTEGSVILYDLRNLQRIELPFERARVPLHLAGISANRAALDPVNHRIFFAPGNVASASYSGCATGPSSRFSIGSFNLITHEWLSIPVACTPYSGLPTSSDQFKVHGIFYSADADRLYVAGMDQTGFAAREATFGLKAYNKTESSLRIRQMNPNSGQVDWELDLRAAGCDRMVNQVGSENVGAFIARFGDALYTYCYGVRSSLQGDQGFAVKIPLDSSNNYKVSDGKPLVRLTPTLPNDLFPMLDPVSGSVLLLTSGPPNGDAVWVFDTEAERFVGVIASGISAVQNRSWTAAGFDIDSGRTYMLSAAGFLVADARHRPLPAGLNFRLQDPDSNPLTTYSSGPTIAVAPKLRRLFLPFPGHKFLVIEDALEDPVDPTEEDPDAGTTGIPEKPGETLSSYAAASAGFGARLLVTGGISRAINNLDYTCYNKVGTVYLFNDKHGRCLADQLLTGGTRDFYMGISQTDFGSQTGAVAFASGAMFSSADTASDRDLKRISSCYADLYEDRLGQPPPNDYRSSCAKLPFSRDFGSGTRGPDAKGAPIPSSTCADFGGMHSQNSQPSMPSYASLVGSSNVECDADGRKVEATGIASGFAFPTVASPIFSIGRAWSTTSSRVTERGTITTIQSVATGINVGPYSIGRVSRSATTRAHGTKGTATVDLGPPVVSSVSGPNINCTICDYRSVVAAMNEGLGLKMRITQPDAEILTSPLGYQSHVIKHPALRESDRASNGDETFTVPALQIIIYNDGHDGRNRFILQLAAVQAESRYGIIPLPDVGEGTLVAPQIDLGAADLLPDESPVLIAADTTSSASPNSIVKRVLRAPAVLIEEAIRFIVHNPREFMVQFILWSFLGAPLYLWLRRRSLLREVNA